MSTTKFSLAIRFEHVRPPIPTRKFDWRCYEDGLPDCTAGWGDCPEEALQNFAREYQYAE